MHRRVVGSLALVSFTAAGCIVPENAKPDVAFGMTLATKFVHRGMTLVDNPVWQPELAVGIPVVNGDQIRLSVEASMDLRNDTGNAWFPDGHAGRYTQIETQASYTRKFGDFTLTAGSQSYNLPNGLEFPNGERGSTNEVFLTASGNVLETTPYLEMHYDYDEVGGAYLRGGISEDIPIATGWKVSLDGSLGYVSEAQGAWMYGLGQAGFADLRGEAVLKYQYDARTEISAGIHGSTIVDSTIDDWFSQLGIDSDPIWFSIGVAWAF